jgi:hypothetical protein
MTNIFKNIRPFYKEALNYVGQKIQCCISAPQDGDKSDNLPNLESNIQEERASRRTFRPRRHYMDGIKELVRINEKYAYTYISNLSYSEKTYQTFREAMETRSATPIDRFVHSLTFRAEAINNGYTTLTEQGNYLCAMALIRMQIDNFLIAWAGLACQNRDKFFMYYDSGKSINKLTDRDGNLLTQGYIVNSYADIDPLIREIYKNGNDYIHPSHVIQEASIDLTSGIQLLSYKEYQCPDSLKREAKKHMMIANNVLCNILCRWIMLKHGNDLGVSNMESDQISF